MAALGPEPAARRSGLEIDGASVRHPQPTPRFERVAALVSSFPQVTHNYMREDRVNLWFTVIAESEEELNRLLAEIKARVPEAEILNLPAKKVFKLRVQFDANECPE